MASHSLEAGEQAGDAVLQRGRGPGRDEGGERHHGAAVEAPVGTETRELGVREEIASLAEGRTREGRERNQEGHGEQFLLVLVAGRRSGSGSWTNEEGDGCAGWWDWMDRIWGDPEREWRRR